MEGQLLGSAFSAYPVVQPASLKKKRKSDGILVTTMMAMRWQWCGGELKHSKGRGANTQHSADKALTGARHNHMKLVLEM